MKMGLYDSPVWPQMENMWIESAHLSTIFVMKKNIEVLFYPATSVQSGIKPKLPKSTNMKYACIFIEIVNIVLLWTLSIDSTDIIKTHV